MGELPVMHKTEVDENENPVIGLANRIPWKE